MGQIVFNCSVCGHWPVKRIWMTYSPDRRSLGWLHASNTNHYQRQFRFNTSHYWINCLLIHEISDQFSECNKLLTPRFAASLHALPVPWSHRVPTVPAPLASWGNLDRKRVSLRVKSLLSHVLAQNLRNPSWRCEWWFWILISYLSSTRERLHFRTHLLSHKALVLGVHLKRTWISIFFS